MSAIETSRKAANYQEKSNHVAPPEVVAPYYAQILAGFPRDMLLGIHGPAHWLRVDANARRLVPLTGAAWLHDSRRRDDCADLGHGDRAALFARALLVDVLRPDQLELLVRAISLHTLGMHSGQDVTSGTRWDADRLELARVGAVIAPERMSTAAGRAMGCKR